jgi:serine/threonine protein kinase
VVRELFGGDIKKISSKPDLITNSFVGTAEYIAPEVISGFGHSSAVDWVRKKKKKKEKKKKKKINFFS